MCGIVFLHSQNMAYRLGLHHLVDGLIGLVGPWSVRYPAIARQTLTGSTRRGWHWAGGVIIGSRTVQAPSGWVMLATRMCRKPGWANSERGCLRC